MAEQEHNHDHDHPAEEAGHEEHEHLGPQGHEHPEPPDAMVAQPGEDEEADAELGNQALADALRISFNWLKFAMVVLVVIYLLMGVFWAGPDEMKFKLRFGEVVSDPITSESGVRIRFPWEEVVTISTQTQEVQLRPEKPEEGEPPSADHFWPARASLNQQGLNLRHDGYVVTGDRNIVHMLLRVRYKVGHDTAGTRKGEAAKNYAFRIGPENAEELLKGLSMAAATRVAATMSVDDVLREKRYMADRIQEELDREIDDLEENMGVDSIGIIVEQGDVDFIAEIGGESIKNPREPYPTQEAFARHQQANSEASSLRQAGQAEAQRIRRQAEARADEIMNRAESEAERLKSRAEADLNVMQSHLAAIYGPEAYKPPYKDEETGEWVVPPLPDHTAETAKKEQVMRQRLYMRAIEQVFRSAAAAFVLHRSEGGAEREVWLDLQRPMQGDGRQGPPMPNR